MKNKTTQGLSDSLKYWRLKCNVNSHISIQYMNRLSRSFSDLLGDNQRKYMCRQHETLECRKFYKPLSNSCHRSGNGSDMCDSTEWYPFVKFLARGGYLFFN